MAKTLNNYRQANYAYLLKHSNNIQESKTANTICTNIYPFSASTVSPEKRRRDSLMSNRKMRYIYSTFDLVLHDRDCSHAAKIPDYAFNMLADYSETLKICPICYRKALIRAGIDLNDTKKIKAYENVFNLLGISTKDLYTLIIENHAQLSGVTLNSVNIKVHEDTWILLKFDNALLLYHNNYLILDNYERIISNGFHPQFDGPVESAHLAVKCMCNYSWSYHAEQFRRIAHEQKTAQLREKLDGVRNWIETKRFSFFYSYFIILDCDNMASQCLKKQMTKASLTSNTSLEITCKIRKRNRNKFFAAMDELKEYSILSENEKYADQCIALLQT